VSEHTGTPAEWLSTLRAPVIEVHCRCPVETAVDRFLARQRHPGHLDESQSRTSLITQFSAFAAAGPVACGPVIVLDTDREIDHDLLLSEIEKMKSGLPNLESR
jgi:glucokinase